MTTAISPAQSLYSYQTALSSSGQSQAVLQILAQAYTASSSALDGTDALTSLVGQANLKPLVTAIYNQSAALQASGTDASAITGLSSSELVGGLSSSSASSMLSQLFGDSTSALQGFNSSITSGTSLATLASQAQKAYGTGNLTASAQSQAASLLDTSGSGSSNASILQAALSAQMAAINNTFTLLA